MKTILSYAMLAVFMVASTFVVGNLAASYDRQLYANLDAAVSAALSGGHSYWQQK